LFFSRKPWWEFSGGYEPVRWSGKQTGFLLDYYMTCLIVLRFLWLSVQEKQNGKQQGSHVLEGEEMHLYTNTNSGLCADRLNLSLKSSLRCWNFVVYLCPRVHGASEISGPGIDGCHKMFKRLPLNALKLTLGGGNRESSAPPRFGVLCDCLCACACEQVAMHGRTQTEISAGSTHDCSRERSSLITSVLPPDLSFSFSCVPSTLPFTQPTFPALWLFDD